MKLLLKILILPVILVLKAVVVLANLMTNLSAYVLSPLILFILGCGIYCLVQARWTDVAILTCMELFILIVMFGTVSIICFVEDLCGSLITFLHS